MPVRTEAKIWERCEGASSFRKAHPFLGIGDSVLATGTRRFCNSCPGVSPPLQQHHLLSAWPSSEGLFRVPQRLFLHQADQNQGCLFPERTSIHFLYLSGLCAEFRT